MMLNLYSMCTTEIFGNRFFGIVTMLNYSACYICGLSVGILFIETLEKVCSTVSEDIHAFTL